MDVLKYIFRYIPQSIVHNGFEYYFQMFINHPHYDFRFCYESYNEDFLYLVENIATQDELFKELKLLRQRLNKDGKLTGDYNTPEGYTIKKYKAWLNEK